MDMPARSTCGKSVNDRNFIKSNLCLKTNHLKCNYQKYVDSQYIKFSNKTWHCYKYSKDLFSLTTINNSSILCSLTRSIVIVIQMNYD